MNLSDWSERVLDAHTIESPRGGLQLTPQAQNRVCAWGAFSGILVTTFVNVPVYIWQTNRRGEDPMLGPGLGYITLGALPTVVGTGVAIAVMINITVNRALRTLS